MIVFARVRNVLERLWCISCIVPGAARSFKCRNGSINIWDQKPFFDFVSTVAGLDSMFLCFYCCEMGGYIGTCLGESMGIYRCILTCDCGYMNCKCSNSEALLAWAWNIYFPKFTWIHAQCIATSYAVFQRFLPKPDRYSVDIVTPVNHNCRAISTTLWIQACLNWATYRLTARLGGS